MAGMVDVVVIGGGAAGLSAALTLARARRSVLVVDDGAPRNAPAGHVHGYLTRDGTPPAELVAAGRAEVESYGGRVVAGRVVDVRRTALADGPGFRVEIEGGGTPVGDGVLARRLVVATGLVDELPEVEGVAERWGRDVLHCPYCHGWEVRDRAVAVLATGPGGVHQALLLRQWTDDVTLLLHTAPDPGEAEWEQLAARGIRVVDGDVERLEVLDDRLTGVRLRSGAHIRADAVVVRPKLVARAGMLASLGLVPEEVRFGDDVVGSALPADPMGATPAAGVWVAGNVSNLMAQVVVAAAAGVMTGAAVNADLVGEETARAVAARRDRAVPFSAEAERVVAERVLGDRRHGM